MHQTSSEYKNEIKQLSRAFECRVTIGKNVYTNKDIVDIILDYPQAQDGFCIGNTISQSLDLTLFNTGEEIYSTNQIKVEIGLRISETIEYILLGYYNVDEVSKNDYTIKFTAFDNMMKFETPYFSNLGDRPILQQVINELASITGVSFTGNVPDYTVTKLEGYTCREVLSYVASLCGGNALITRDGRFTIKKLQNVDYSITTDNHFGITTEEVAYKVGKITCVIDSEKELSKGGLGTDSMELGFENPWMTESILNTLYQQLNGFSYLGFQTKWQGDLSLDPYDSILIQDRKGTSHRVPILSQKFTYVGGLTSELGAKGESKNKNSFSSSGSNSNKVNRLVTEQAIIKEALINKANIQDLEAVSIRTQRLEATTAKIETAIIDVAYVSDLNVIRANISELKAMDATISQAVINKADISELNAAVANINILNADLGVIKNLVNGNLSSENIQTGGITSDKLTIANGFIKDAMIDSLNANKIKVGQINTALVQVASSSGNLIINDNTIQIRDANRVRFQIGKDSSNDYYMSVWDSSGKLMFDARGLKADAIKDSIIRNDMISTNANIDGSKLNISSVVSEINEGSTTLKASKVQFDGIAQTLEVAFNLLKTQADGTKSQTESNTTAINVAQGKINTLIQDTTITKDGQSVKLKDEYSKLEQTVGSLSSTIGKQQTTIDDHSGKITATNSEISSLKQNINGLSASVSSAQTTIQSHTQQLVQKADLETVNKKIDAIPFVGRNLFLNSDFSSQESWAGLPTISKDGTINYIRSSSTFITSQKVDVIKGEEYVVSALVRAVTTTPTNFSIKFNVGNYNSTNIDITSTDWVRVSVTITAKSTIKEQIYLCNRGNAGIDIAFVKLEKGTKDTDWSLAPEDIQASIDAKANSADVYVKTEVYTKAQTDAAIKIAKDEINLGVSSTYETKTNVETQINGVKSSVTNLESRISKAEQKITDSAIIQTVSQTINQAKTEAIQSANSNTANQLKNYSTTLQMNSAIQQKADSITSDVFKIETSLAVDNLLSNGNFTNELNNWQYRDHGSSVNYTLTANTDWTMTGKTALLITQSNHPQGYDSGFTQEIDVKPNTDYTFTGYIASHRAEGMAVVKDDAGNWLVFDKTDADYDQYTGGPEVSRWKKIRLVYWSGNRTKLQLHLAMGKSNNNGHVWFHDFMVTEGDTDLCWKPSERETRTRIDQLSDRITSTVSSIQTVDGKVNQAQSQIDQQAHQIASKVNSGDFSSLIQQNSSSIYTAISNGRGVHGVGIDTSGLYLFNNNLVTARLTEGKFHAYNSWNGQHMGYFGTNGDDLRACLYDTNTFSVYSNDTALLFRARYERDANYGNATLDMCGGINFIHKPGQDVGINQLLLGNDDRSDRYGFHNMSIRCWNSFGFQDNYGYTNMFFDSRRGRVIMKGALYQNTQTPPATFSMNFDGEDEIYSSGYERSQAIDSVMNLKTGVYVDNDGECCSAIYGGYSELITTEYQDEYGKITTHLNHEALNASLVVTCQEQQKLIKALQKELNEIKEYLNVA